MASISQLTFLPPMADALLYQHDILAAARIDQAQPGVRCMLTCIMQSRQMCWQHYIEEENNHIVSPAQILEIMTIAALHNTSHSMKQPSSVWVALIPSNKEIVELLHRLPWLRTRGRARGTPFMNVCCKA